MSEEFHKWCQELKDLLNQPLPGGRGFQRQRDRDIQHIAKKLSQAELPDRTWHGG